jgi:transcriptional regulator with XRE-family HTH domain
MSKPSQAKTSRFSNYPGLWERLTDSLGTRKTREIAGILSVSDSLVSDWKADRAFPTLGHLFMVAEIGHTSLDWLLTGEKPKHLEVKIDSELTAFDGVDRRMILHAARRLDLPIEDTVKRLVHDGLTLQGVVTVEPAGKLRTSDMKAIVHLLDRIAQLPWNDGHNLGMKVINVLINRMIGHASSSAAADSPPVDLGVVDEFDIGKAVREYDDPRIIMEKYFESQGKDTPVDFVSSVSLDDWQSLSAKDKVAQIEGMIKIYRGGRKRRKMYASTDTEDT